MLQRKIEADLDIGNDSNARTGDGVCEQGLMYDINGFMGIWAVKKCIGIYVYGQI